MNSIKNVGKALGALLIVTAYAAAQDFAPGLLWPNGIEPGKPETCEAPDGSKCWYVDADAPDGGNGTYSAPYNGFKECVGYLEGTTYHQGAIKGGDYLYLKGTFNNGRRIQIYRDSQLGTKEKPTVIKTYLGTPRAVFDGEGTQGGLGMLASGFAVVQNLEITNTGGAGFTSHATGTEFVNIVAHHSKCDGFVGTGGAIRFMMQGNKPYDNILRNSYIHHNNINPDGSPYNQRAVLILSEPACPSTAKISIYDNIIHDERAAISDKHSGGFQREIYNNLIYNIANYAFFVRSANSSIHHNVIYKSKYGVFVWQEQQKANIFVTLSHNTINAVSCFTGTGCANCKAYDSVTVGFDVKDNIFWSTTAATGSVSLDANQDANFGMNTDQWSSSHNMFVCRDNIAFLWHLNSRFNFENGMAYVGDNGSFMADTTGFVDEANMNFSLQTNSPAIGAASDGGDIGAFPYGKPALLPEARTLQAKAPIAPMAGKGSVVYDIHGRKLGPNHAKFCSGVYIDMLNVRTGTRTSRVRLANDR